MPPPEPVRHVVVTASGARHWLAQPQRSPERDVIEHLLLLGDQRPVDLGVMSRALSWSTAELAKVLFVLNRSQAIQVNTGPSRQQASGGDMLAGIDDDLQALAGPGQRAVLASDDGFCLGASGWEQNEADRRAAELVAEEAVGRVDPSWCWSFAREHLVFAFSARIDSHHPAWLRLARRLLLTCGPLGPDREAA